LNDILSISAGGDVEFNQHNAATNNGNLYLAIWLLVIEPIQLLQPDRQQFKEDG
jgi:hypothetical protein